MVSEQSLVNAVDELICGDSLTRAPVPNSPEWIENVLAVRDRVAELEKELATATEDEAREWTTNHNLREHIVELEAELAAQSFKEYAAAQTIGHATRTIGELKEHIAELELALEMSVEASEVYDDLTPEDWIELARQEAANAPQDAPDPDDQGQSP